MREQPKKLFRVILTDTTTMESTVLNEYDDRKIADEVAMKLKDYYWHRGGWISVDEIEIADTSAA